MSYRFISYNQGGHAFVEASSDVWEPSYTLRLPMETLYSDEVSYILDTEDWQDPTTKDMPWDYDDGTFGKEFSYEEFVMGEAPKFVSWWIGTLPNTSTKFRLRRKLWTRKLTHLLRRFILQERK
tara:strand:+ start:1184 stop:1555 length:372 start_codon:yes stop_codon:yes gene_type:complete